MTFNPLKALGLASALALTVAGVAIAEAPPPPHMMDGPGHHMGMDPEAMAKHHADHLRAVLQLTPAQEPALAALVASMKPPAGGHDKMKAEHEAMANLTTPERLEHMRAMITEHLAAMDQHIAAVKTFYAQLTAPQRKAFDAQSMMMLHGHMGGMHPMHGMPGMGGHEAHPG